MIPLLLATLAWPIQPPPPERPSPAPCVCICQSAAAPVAPGSSPQDAPTGLPAPAGPSPAAPPVATYRSTIDTHSPPDHWYGGPAVASDIASFTLVGLGGAWNSAGVFLLGAGGYALGAPINHLANGYPGRALASLGIRALGVGVATGALLLDVVAHPCDGEPSCQHSPALGLTLGAAALLGAMALDDALLAREPVRARGAGASLTPALVVAPSLAFVSLGGAF